MYFRNLRSFVDYFGRISLLVFLNPLAHKDLSFRFTWRTLSYKERVVIRDTVNTPTALILHPRGETPASGGRTWKDNDAHWEQAGRSWSIHPLRIVRSSGESCIHLWSSSSYVTRAFEREALRDWKEPRQLSTGFSRFSLSAYILWFR